MNRPLIVIDDAPAFADTPEIRRLSTELLLAGRKTGIQEQPEPRPRATQPCWQYLTVAAAEAADRRQ